jgi:hypothetical protein
LRHFCSYWDKIQLAARALELPHYDPASGQSFHQFAGLGRKLYHRGRTCARAGAVARFDRPTANALGEGALSNPARTVAAVLEIMMAHALVAENGGGGNRAPGDLIDECGIVEMPIPDIDAGRFAMTKLDHTWLDTTTAVGDEIKAMVARLNHDDLTPLQGAIRALQTDDVQPMAQDNRQFCSTGPFGYGTITQFVENSADLCARSLALIGSFDHAAINRLLSDIKAYAAMANRKLDCQDGHGIAHNAGTIAGLLGHALQIGDRRLAESAAAALSDSAADVAARDSALSDGALWSNGHRAERDRADEIEAAAPAVPSCEGASAAQPCGAADVRISPSVEIDMVPERGGARLSLALAEIVAQLTTFHPGRDTACQTDTDAAGAGVATQGGSAAMVALLDFGDQAFPEIGEITPAADLIGVERAIDLTGSRKTTHFGHAPGETRAVVRRAVATSTG